MKKYSYILFFLLFSGISMMLQAGGPPPPPPPPKVEGVQPDIYENKWPDGTQVKINGDYVVAKPASPEFTNWINTKPDKVIPKKTKVKIPNGTIVEIGDVKTYTKWAQADFDPNFTVGEPAPGPKPPAPKPPDTPAPMPGATGKIIEKDWKKFPEGTVVTLKDRTTLTFSKDPIDSQEYAKYLDGKSAIINVIEIKAPDGQKFVLPPMSHLIEMVYNRWVRQLPKDPGTSPHPKEGKPAPAPGPMPPPSPVSPFAGQLSMLDVELSSLTKAVT